MWHRLYYHLVWTTRLREPLLDATSARFLCRYARRVASHHRIRILTIGAVRTHVHVLLTASPQTVFSAFIGAVKGGSSTTWNRDYAITAGWTLRWAPGYGLSTVGRRQIDAVCAYLRDQPLHHPEEQIEEWEGDRQSHEDLRWDGS